MGGSDVDRFRRVDAIFDAALDLPAGERVAFIEHECGEDAELRRELLELLEARRRSEEFLEAPALRFAAPLLEGSDLLPAGSGVAPQYVGPFRVLRPLGRGGMGAVYLGEREDGRFRQRAALKLVRQEGIADDGVRRFLEERRILALLEHPNIARLIDAGIAADGRPYFAMEYVEGEPLDRYCDARRLPVEGRLELFGAVCEAVEYAHRHLVVHRDLKPSNILVATDGQLKLLDFGIAKLLVPLAADDDAPLTRTGLHPMTPEFAAPEQVRGEPISTATDVYALGVLLYLLLTGRPPYELRGRTPAEVERIVCDDEPAGAAAAFDAGRGEPDSIERALARGGTPERLRRQLRGDLELIVRKALHKEPARRYPSVAALREDLERFRRRRPVLARPDSAAYRVRRFVGRHRGGVAVATGIGLLLLGVGFRERTLRGRAEAEARKARAVQAYVVSIFDASDPFTASQQAGGDVTARALLDRGAARVDSELAGQPAEQAELRGVLGRVYASLGLFEQALPHLERSLAQRRALYGPRHPEVAEAADQLGEALLDRGRLDEAEPLLREGLDLRRRLLGGRNAATAASLDHLATLLQERGRYDEAESLFREALQVRRTLLGNDDPAVASSLTNLGLLLYLKGAYDAAEPLQREALEIQRRRLGENHPLTAQTLNNLAQVQELRGREDEAESLFRRALAAKRAALGDLHPSVTIALNNLGYFLLMERDRPEEAEPLVRQALALDRRIFGEPHEYVASSTSNLALILAAEGKLDESERLYRQVLAMRRSLFGERHPRVATSLSYLAGVRQRRGDLPGALSLYRQAAAIYADLLGTTHPNYTTTTVNIARVLKEQGKLDEAERLFRASMAGLNPTNRAQYATLLSARIGLGEVLAARGRTEEALPLLEQALRMALDRYGEDRWRTAEARLALGQVLAGAGERSRAEPLLRQADDVLQKHRGEQPRLAAQASAALAGLHRASSRAAGGPR